MAAVVTIKSPAELPPGGNYVILRSGWETGQAQNISGITITIGLPDGIKEAEFAKALDSATRLADSEGISTVYVIDGIVAPSGGPGHRSPA